VPNQILSTLLHAVESTYILLPRGVHTGTLQPPAPFAPDMHAKSLVLKHYHRALFVAGRPHILAYYPLILPVHPALGRCPLLLAYYPLFQGPPASKHPDVDALAHLYMHPRGIIRMRLCEPGCGRVPASNTRIYIDSTVGKGGAYFRYFLKNGAYLRYFARGLFQIFFRKWGLFEILADILRY
jgi:hypothetical protein